VAVTGDWWLEDGEKAILDFHAEHSLERYQRLAFMRPDADVVPISPSSVDRVPRAARLRERHHAKPFAQGQGFPSAAPPA
jgi:hypothetical protein